MRVFLPLYFLPDRILLTYPFLFFLLLFPEPVLRLFLLKSLRFFLLRLPPKLPQLPLLLLQLLLKPLLWLLPLFW